MDLCNRKYCCKNKIVGMGINKYNDIVESDFEIFGQAQSEWERFEKGKDYQAFVVQRKKT